MRERRGEREAWTEFIEHGQAVPINKFGNKRTEYDGRWYASKREAAHAAQLNALLRAGHIRELRIQHPIVLVPANGKLRAITYIADFSYIDSDGTFHVVDAKGFKTQVYRLKKRMAALLLGIEIEEV